MAIGTIFALFFGVIAVVAGVSAVWMIKENSKYPWAWMLWPPVVIELGVMAVCVFVAINLWGVK